MYERRLDVSSGLCEKRTFALVISFYKSEKRISSEYLTIDQGVE